MLAGGKARAKLGYQPGGGGGEPGGGGAAGSGTGGTGAAGCTVDFASYLDREKRKPGSFARNLGRVGAR